MEKKLLSILIPGIVLIMWGCNPQKNEKEEDITYPVTNALCSDISINKEYVAKIQSLRNIEIRAMEKGFLQDILVEEGQKVVAGQTLFRIMPQSYEAELSRAKAVVEQAKIELQNTSSLVKNNVVSKNEKEMAQAKLEEATAEMRLAQLHLEYTNIKAPFSGVINRIPKKDGSLIDEGELLTSLSDNSFINVYFNLSEPEYLDYQSHFSGSNKQPVSLIMANGELHPEKGTIQNIEGEFDNETGNIAFRAKFPNKNQILRNGETGKIRMEIPLENALLIPQKSTFEIQDKKYIFVVDKDGVAHSKDIEVSYELPNVYVVSKGLSKNDRFLVEGVQKVKDGDKLKVSFQNNEKVMQSLSFKAN